MKLKATKRQMREGFYRIVSFGNWYAQYLLSEEKPIACPTWVDRWWCDCYEIDGVLVLAGYSQIANKNMRQDYELVWEYENKARNSERKDRPALLRELLKKLEI